MPFQCKPEESFARELAVVIGASLRLFAMSALS
jgi:hypothetical protein